MNNLATETEQRRLHSAETITVPGDANSDESEGFLRAHGRGTAKASFVLHAQWARESQALCIWPAEQSSGASNEGSLVQLFIDHEVDREGF